MPATQEHETLHTASEVNGEVAQLDVGTRPPYHVFPEAIPELWPLYRPFILRMLERGDGCYAEHDILALLLMGKWSLIAAERDGEVVSVGIIEVVNFPRKRELLVKFAAGDMEPILASLPWLEGRARALNCDAVEMLARDGWSRKLPGWKKAWVILRKDLE